ncbi:MAG: tRNA preQ1(34) S-adenosylmethionine ribosyltransferase-isomerase QueA [Treponema sp.]|jgi:S-adenosylmethionine:tRNA ribosyltransferase-isomerase|nr:tRNA preQ1(34) S-adenosylmethionine ribosyltransferase-isomerase QueA [Treponema sp.]
MKTGDFFFELPESLIAQEPLERGKDRLMLLERSSGKREHRLVADLPYLLGSEKKLLGEKPLLVFNDSRVRKARLYGISVETGARVEFLLLRKQDEEGRIWLCMAQRAKRRRPGSRYVFGSGSDSAEAVIIGLEGEFRVLQFARVLDESWLDIHGRIPLPPYIKREDNASDSERYQTVFAGETGSAAAPTAGLHFTGELLEELEKAGAESAFITLHVGLGTFLPVRSDTVEEHRMHEEFYSIDRIAAEKINRAAAEGRRICAIGTTSVRTLESAWNAETKSLPAGEGSTSIFIYPGYRFALVDALFTNFHTPESTLLMLVSAFAAAFAGTSRRAGDKERRFPSEEGGGNLIMESYGEAVEKGYRFYSYGDAMLIY